jgi:hypothetical protein
LLTAGPEIQGTLRAGELIFEEGEGLSIEG